jgi:hypothetical protein
MTSVRVEDIQKDLLDYLRKVEAGKPWSSSALINLWRRSSR